MSDTPFFIWMSGLAIGIALLVVAFIYPSEPNTVIHHKIQVIDICEANPAANRCSNPWSPFKEVEAK